MGTLYVVATPIGNLEDMSPRAVRILREVALIAAEDTRRTGRLLTHFGIATPMISYHAFNVRSRRERLLAALAAGDVALVSDSGTPAISDPGQDLVAAAVAAGFPVSPIPGPSAITAAVSASGLVTGPFISLGFLPRQTADRRRALARAAATGFALVLLEAPGRTPGTLAELAEALGDRPAAVMRELTKLHEEIRHGSLATLATQYRVTPARGEIVIVVAAGDESTAPVEEPERVIERLLATGMRPSEVAREAAVITGLPRSVAYQIALEAEKSRKDRRIAPNDHV